MLRTFPRLRPLVLALVVVTASVVAARALPAAAAAAGTVERVNGSNRVATAAAVASQAWGTATDVLLATAYDYPDAVAAAGLSARRDAPVLLTTPDHVPSELRDALTRLGTKRVTILGGEKAVSATVASELQAMGLVVDRINGNDRFDTAARIAAAGQAMGPVNVVALALGMRSDARDAWPDALAAASLAGLEAPAPTLLTLTDRLPDATKRALADLKPQHVIALGGPNAIGDAVLQQVRDLGFEVTRVDGATRFATAVAVANTATNGTPGSDSTIDATEAVVVSGEDFPDALSAGALAARRSAALILVPGERLDDTVDAYLRHSTTPVQSITVVGGPGVVDGFVVDELRAALTGEPRPTPPPACDLAYSSPDCTYTYEHSVKMWEDMAQCEAGGRWDANTGNGYYGGLQFNKGSWDGTGGTGYPHQNSKWEQIHRGEILQDRQGWGAWPSCSSKLGYR